MRISLLVDGGFTYFPGLDNPLEIDTTQIAADEAFKLDALVGACNFFSPSEPTISEPIPDSTDIRVYTLTIAEGEKSRTIRVADPVKDEALSALIAHLRNMNRAR